LLDWDIDVYRFREDKNGESELGRYSKVQGTIVGIEKSGRD